MIKASQEDLVLLADVVESQVANGFEMYYSPQLFIYSEEAWRRKRCEWSRNSREDARVGE